jgi:hypothetical protein
MSTSDHKQLSNEISSLPVSSLPPLDLPPPRIWKAKDLANFLRVSMSWIYQRTKQDAEDPIPRVGGVGRLLFDSQSPEFQSWMRRQLSCTPIDNNK